jgi:ubiquinone/menaquinone biosynthesis C-methylase UbiE
MHRDMGMSGTNPADSGYLHGYSPEEQRRLVEQAEYWRETLILPELPYRPGERLLDVGCGAGAVLGVIAAAHPGLRFAGIDREPAQIAAARRHLESLGVRDADLRVGDATHLPWPDASFDHAYLMWFVEHVPHIEPILREVRRVLVPGGTITVNETEYESYHVWPENEDWEYLEAAMYRHFAEHGQPHAGRRIGTLLVEAGFQDVTSRLVGSHFFVQPGCDALRRHAAYTADYLGPAIPEFVKLGFDRQRLERGLAHLLALHEHPHGAFTQQIYRGRGRA